MPKKWISGLLTAISKRESPSPKPISRTLFSETCNIFSKADLVLSENRKSFSWFIIFLWFADSLDLALAKLLMDLKSE